MLRRFWSKYGNKKQLYWWIGSYFIIIALLTAVNSLGYTEALRVVERDVREIYQSGLENTGTVCDSYLTRAMGDLYSIVRSSSVEQMAVSQLTQHNRLLYGTRVQKDIGSVLVSNNDILECGVVFKDRDICVHSGLGLSDLDAAYQAWFGQWYDSREAWLGDLFSVSGPMVVTREGGKKAQQRDLFIIYRIPTLNPNVAVIARFNSVRLGELLQKSGGQEVSTYMIDDAGDSVIPTEGEREFPRQEEGLVRIDGREYFALWKDSEATPFRYIQLIPRDVYLANIKHVRLAVEICSVLGLILAGALALVFSAANERKKQDLDAQLAAREGYVRRDRLRQALEGRLTLSEEEIVTQYPFLCRGEYTVLLFDFLLPASENEAGLDYQLLCRHIAGQVLRNRSEKDGCFCVVNEMCVGILAMDGEGGLQSLKESAAQACTDLNREMNLEARCSISRPTTAPEHLHECYEEALEIMGQRYLGAENTVFVYGEIMPEYPGYGMIAQGKERLISLLLQGEQETVRAETERLWEKGVTLGVRRVLVSEIMSAVLSAAVQMGAENQMNMDELYRIPLRGTSVQELEQSKEMLLRYMEQLCALVGRETESSSKYREVAAYIDEHYSDPMLNVNTLADTFDISRSWLSRSFKKEMNISLAEYIVLCRLRRAKELLLTNKSVNKIAAEVGFTNESVFYRAFKKYEKITTQQYRKLKMGAGE